MTSAIRRVSRAICAAIAIAALVAVPVSAETLVRDRYSDSDTGTWSDCGPTYEFEGSWGGLFTLKSGHAGDPTPYLTDNYHWDWINRNPANGSWFSERGQGQYKDVKITHLYGTTYRFIAQESGSAYTITTSDGRKILMDRGLLRYQFDVDTLGDSDLDNDVFVEGSFQLLADHGSHPFWHMTDAEYCAVVNDLLG